MLATGFDHSEDPHARANLDLLIKGWRVDMFTREELVARSDEREFIRAQELLRRDKITDAKKEGSFLVFKAQGSAKKPYEARIDEELRGEKSTLGPGKLIAAIDRLTEKEAKELLLECSGRAKDVYARLVDGEWPEL
jgi:hypothetical protein